MTGTYGSVTINADGSYSYALDNGDADTNALAQGQTRHRPFTYTVIDAIGATSSATLTITSPAPTTPRWRLPTSTAPTWSSRAGVNPGNTPFAGDPSAAGNVLTNDTDVDAGETKAVSAVNGWPARRQPVAGTYGSVTIDADGSYSYALDNGDADTNALAQGQSHRPVHLHGGRRQRRHLVGDADHHHHGHQRRAGGGCR